MKSTQLQLKIKILKTSLIQYSFILSLLNLLEQSKEISSRNPMEFHLAPMKNICCWAFRASIFGITDSYVEMINLESLLNNKRNAWNLIDTYPIKNQNQWLQILTHNLKDISLLPKILIQFFKNNPERNNIYGVNINAGCPDPNIISAGDGAALIKRTKRLIDLVKSFLSVPESQNLHLSCKLRIGLNEREMNYKKVGDFLESLRSIDDHRLKPPIIHFKHAKQSSKESPHWEFLESFLNINVPIIINGDISNPNDIKKIKEILPNDLQNQWNNLIAGIMIGRGILKNPICFEAFKANIDNRVDESQWKILFQNNLKVHPPQKKYLVNLGNCYPFILKKGKE